MKGAGDLFGVFVGEGSDNSVHHLAQLAGVVEEHFARLVAEGGGSSASLLCKRMVKYVLTGMVSSGFV